MRELDIDERHDKLVQDIRAARKKLAPSSSSDASFWSSRSSLLTMDSERIGLYATMQYRDYQREERVAALSREQWDTVDEKARDYLMQKMALSA